MGRRIESPFIDVHGHLGTWRDTYIPKALDESRIIAEMDRYGCGMSWISAADPGYGGDPHVKNSQIFAAGARHPGRLLPWVTLSAHLGDSAVHELRRCLDLGPCVGVKMHRYAQPAYSLTSAFLRPVLEVLDDHKMVYLNHAFPDIADLEAAAGRYTNVAFLAGHFDAEVLTVASRCPNVLDCTCGASKPGCLEAAVRRGAASSLLVGSDFPLFNLGFGIGLVAFADIDEADKSSIVGGNAIRLLQRFPWYPA